MTKVGQALAQARVAAGMTQRELCGIIGIPQGFLSEIERGVRELPPQRRERLPAALRAAVLAAQREALLATLAALDRDLAQLAAGPPRHIRRTG